MPSGEPYPSGTAYEVLTAIEQSKAKGRPNVYLFRKTAPAVLPVEDEKSRALVNQQLDREGLLGALHQNERGSFQGRLSGIR
jgi:hypothetical protein